MRKKKADLEITDYKQVTAKAPKVDKSKPFYIVSSVDARPNGNRTRPWAYWESEKDAIAYVENGWSDGAFFYEGGYYTHVVIERHMLNHPLSTYVKGEERKQIWFRLDLKRGGTVKTVRCKRPKRYARVIGFH